MAGIALVLLPGLDGTGLLFADFVAELKKSAPEVEPIVVRYPTDHALGYAELERIAREALPKDRPFVLLGESFSGPIAISIAASRPAALAGLVLVCTFARYPRRLFRSLQQLAPLVPVKGRIVSLARKIAAQRPVAAAVEAKLMEASAQVSSEVFRARVRELLQIDVSEKVREIDVPILDLRSLKDGVVPNRAGNLIRRLGNRVTVVEMDAPHFVLQAMPKETAAMIADFVRKTTA
jgi:pimeloyl-[acyl-carrier protein] methyl ester esterase